MPDRGKCGEEFGEHIKHAGNLRLLEHDLGDKNLVGTDRPMGSEPPRKIIPFIFFVPSQNLGLEQGNTAILVRLVVFVADTS